MSDESKLSRPMDGDDEAPMEPWLQALADDYNRPPPAPRELMWARIQAARAAGAGVGDAGGDAMAASEQSCAVVVDDGERLTRPIQLVGGEESGRVRRTSETRRADGVGRRGLYVWRWPSLGMAAALLLVAALGWWRRGAEPQAPEAPTVAVSPAKGASTESSVDLPAAATVSGVASGLPERSVTAAAPTLPRRLTSRSGVVSSPSNSARLVSNAVAGGDEVGAGATFESAPYRIAAAQHLGQVEALLTVFRAESGRDVADPSLQPWARDLLTTTRLLLDSPAARDERMDVLLGELEPVLVQIVQLPAARAAEERQLIVTSLERSSLLTQLRSVVPAGTAVPQRAGE